MSNKDMDINISEPNIYTIPMNTDINQKIVKISMASCDRILGKSIMKGVDFGCDASSFTAAGIPSVVLGPGNILQAHTKDEFVSLKEVCQAAEVYSQICVDF